MEKAHEGTLIACLRAGNDRRGHSANVTGCSASACEVGWNATEAALDAVNDETDHPDGHEGHEADADDRRCVSVASICSTPSDGCFDF